MKLFTTSIKVVVLFVFISCQDTNNNSEIQMYESGQYIRLTLDDNTPNLSNGIQYFNGGNPLMFNLNWKENSIQIFNLNTQKNIKKIKFDKEGPLGVSDIFGFHVHNLDSIFLFNHGIGRIYLTDTSGNVYSTIKYKAPEEYSTAFIHNSYFVSNPVILGDKMIVKTRFNGHIGKITNEELSKKELLYSIDLTNGTTDFLGLTYPKDYFAEGIKYVEPSISYANGKYVVSYFGDHNIYIIDSSNGEIQSNKIKSHFVEETLPTLAIDADPFELRTYAYASSHYENIIYDPYRNLFLRFVFHKYDLDPTIDMYELRNYSGPFSIQLLDEDLNLLYEKSFEQNVYHPFDFFIAKEGLYLSINHPLNPSNVEDVMAFELIKID